MVSKESCTFANANKKHKNNKEIMVNDFLKKYYIQILDKAKKDIHDCRVYLHDFKGNYSRLQALETNVKQLGIHTNGYDVDGRDGFVLIDNIAISDIKTLHSHYHDCLCIDNTCYKDKSFDEIMLSLNYKKNKIISKCNREIEITS